METSVAEMFTAFVEDVGARVRHALIAAYGPEVGAEATSEAFAYAWEHSERVGMMENLAGYLYRVGQSKSRRYLRRPIVLPMVPAPTLRNRGSSRGFPTPCGDSPSSSG